MSTSRRTPASETAPLPNPVEPDGTAPSVGPAVQVEPAGLPDPTEADVRPLDAVEVAAPAAASVEPVTAPPAGASPRRFLARLARLLLAVLVIAAIIVGVIVGGPILYDRYVAPIGVNTADLGAVRNRLSEVQAELDAIGERQAAVDARLGSVEEQIAGHDRRLASLDAITGDLATADATTNGAVAREISVLKAMELMSRARLFLYESNFGLAAQDLAAARYLLGGLRGGASGTDATAIAAAVERLDRTLAALPEFPVVASDDLDIAWQALLGNVAPAVIPSVAPSPSVTPEPSPTTTP